MSVLWDPNYLKCYNKLHKHVAWKDIAKVMGTVSPPPPKKKDDSFTFFFQKREGEEEYGRVVV